MTNVDHGPSPLADAAKNRTIAPDARTGSEHQVDGHDDQDHGHDHDHTFDWPEMARIAVVAVAAAAVWFRVWEPFSAVSVIGVAGLLMGGWPILKEASENILERRMTMELSMTIAVVAAAAIGEFVTALIITLFVLVAEVLEGLTVGRGRKAIRDLLEFLLGTCPCGAPARSGRSPARRSPSVMRSWWHPVAGSRSMGRSFQETRSSMSPASQVSPCRSRR